MPVFRSLQLCLLQPRKIEEIKDFLLTARRKDAKCEYSIDFLLCLCAKDDAILKLIQTVVCFLLFTAKNA